MGGTGSRAERRMRGFEPAAGLLRDTLRAAGEARGFAQTRVLTHWAEIVGADIAALCRPVRLRYGREGLGGTLTLLVAGAAAPQVQMQLPAIRDRVNACYGYAAVARITLTQTAPDGLAEPAAPWVAAPAAPAAATAADAAAADAARLADGVKDPALRAALEGLARNVISRTGRAAAAGVRATGKDST